MKPYADTNFFTRLYLLDSDSQSIKDLLDESLFKGSAHLPITWLHRMETLNAFQLCVFVGKDPGRIRVTAEQAASAHASFEADAAESLFMRRTRMELETLERQFEELALRHTARHGFRTYDILHVASALLLGCDQFWSFDPKAARLAKLEGLKIL